MNMNPEMISVMCTVASTVVAIVAVIISVLTLRQNSKTNERASRPYIQVYGTYIYIGDTQYYLVLKNFGKTGAKITKFSCNIDLSRFAVDGLRVPMSNMVGAYCAPGMTMAFLTDTEKILACDTEMMVFDIEYQSGKRYYTDTISINLIVEKERLHLRQNCSGNELKMVSHALQEIAERLL